MITVTRKKIEEVEETFGLIDMGILFRGHSLMLKVPVDTMPWQIERLEKAADQFHVTLVRMEGGFH